MKTTSYNEPRQLFLDTVVDFYKKLGDKSFWADTKCMEIALEALSQDYIRTDHSGFVEEDAMTLYAAINEYRIREKYMQQKRLENKFITITQTNEYTISPSIIRGIIEAIKRGEMP